uniref:Uncharacterized protein n=1 Tax=viral metagenome TaxID=1070528 RepID=A0A6C0IIZ1_9ZZZZ
MTVLTAAHLALAHDVGLQAIKTLALLRSHLLEAHLLGRVALVGESYHLFLQHHVSPAEASLNGVIQILDQHVHKRMVRAGDARAHAIVVAGRARHFAYVVTPNAGPSVFTDFRVDGRSSTTRLKGLV